MNRSKEMLEEAIAMAKADRDGAMLEILVPLRKELAKLSQALKDLVDFDMGDSPELDGLDAALGPAQLKRMEAAWVQAVAVNGAREGSRHCGDKP